MAKKILVTGGAGFIGSHTVVELYAAGYEPVIIDNFCNSSPDVLKGIEKITGHKPKLYEQDYANKDALISILKDEKIEGVIHFAALKAVDVSISKPLEYYYNNIAGLINLLSTMEEVGIKALVFSSSCTVYGEPDSLPVTEASAIKPSLSPYGASKQMGEQIIKDAVAASDGICAVALRYFNPVGAHPSGNIGELPMGVPANLVPYVTQAVAGLRPKLIVNGNDYPTPDGTCIRDYIHVVDLAKAHIKTLEYIMKQDSHFYDVINVGTGTGSSILEVLTTFKTVNKIDVPYEIGPRREGDVVSTYASVDKANELLDWHAEKNLSDALRDAWRWQQNLSTERE